MPEGFQPRRVGRRRRPRGRGRRNGRRRADRADAGRGRRQPGAHPATWRRSASCATRTGALMIVDEIQTGFGRTGQLVRLRARRHRARRRRRWPRRSATACRSAPAGPGTRSPRCSSRATTAARTAATAIATSAVNAVIGEMRRIDAPALAAEQGARLAPALAALPGVSEVRGRGLLLAAELEPATPPPAYRAPARRGPRRPTPSRRPRCASPRRSPCPTTRSTRRVGT